METTDKLPVSDWQPTTDKLELAHLGKYGEELGELIEVTSEMMYLGINKAPHESLTVITAELMKEIADVMAMQQLLAEHYGMADEYELPIKRTVTWERHEILRSLTTLAGGMVNIISRCVIQGVDEIDPSTKLLNKERLKRQMEQMNHSMEEVIRVFLLDRQDIHERIEMKKIFKREWHDLIRDQTTTDPEANEAIFLRMKNGLPVCWVVWALAPGDIQIVAICSRESIAKRYMRQADVYPEHRLTTEMAYLDHLFGSVDLRSVAMRTTTGKNRETRDPKTPHVRTGNGRPPNAFPRPPGSKKPTAGE